MAKQRNELTQAEFIRQSGISESKVRRAITSGKIQGRNDYKSVYIPKSELERVKQMQAAGEI